MIWSFRKMLFRTKKQRIGHVRLELNVYVCAKYVPESTETNKIDLSTRRLVRTGVPQELDTQAACALEEGLRLVEQQGGSVVLVTMGPEEAEQGVRRGLAMGADRGILISDPLLAGSDALGTARALAAALRAEPFDLILCAAESSDSYTGLVPGMLAELLDIPQLTFAKQIEVGDGTATIHRQTAYGYQVVQASPPVLITVASGINEPRYPALKGVLAARKKEVRLLGAADLGLGPEEVGETAARERVLAVQPALRRAAGEIVVDEGEGGKQIADFLARMKAL